MNSLDFETLSASLFSREAFAALSDSDYQRLTAALYAAPYSTRMNYAEILFRYNRNVETRSLGAFLACTAPSAHRLADRLFQKIFPLLRTHCGAVLRRGGSVRPQILPQRRTPEEVAFTKGLSRTLYSGTIRAAFHRNRVHPLCDPGVRSK